MALAEITQRVDAAKKAIDDEKADHKKRLEALEGELEIVEAERKHALAGTDPDTLRLAQHVVYVRGRLEDNYNQWVVDTAVSDIAAGAPRLATEYIGVKNYAQFRHQDCSGPYHTGPKHGTVVFSVGLTEKARKRLADGGELTAEEKDAAIKYLSNLKAAGVA